VGLEAAVGEEPIVIPCPKTWIPITSAQNPIQLKHHGTKASSASTWIARIVRA
jgi:hypothetical protein